MSTTATKKQSEAIRQRMQEIRCEMPYHMDAAKSEVKDYFDWKVQLRRHPWLAASVVAIVAYSVVPAKQRPRQVIHEKASRLSRALPFRSQEQHEEEVQKSSFLSGMLGSLLTLALRSGATFATRQIASQFSQSMGRPRSNSGPTSPYDRSSSFRSEPQR